METPVKAPTAIETERADWKTEYDRRLSTLDEKSAKDKQEFNDWLDGFRIKGILVSSTQPGPLR